MKPLINQGKININNNKTVKETIAIEEATKADKTMHLEKKF